MLSALGSAARFLAGHRARTGRWLLAVALVLSALLAARPGVAQKALPLPQLWSGKIVLAEGVNPGLTGDRFELRIARLSSDAEVLQLGEELRLGGQARLRDAMRRLQPKGFLTVGKLAGSEVTVIRAGDLPNGHRVVRVFCDFPIRLFDKSEPRGSTAHPFAFLELEVDSSGVGGTGTLIAAASLTRAEDGLRIDNAETPPMRLIEVATDSPPPAPK